MAKLFRFALVFLLAGCTAWQPLRHTDVPSGPPEFYQHYYDYPKAAPTAEITQEENTSSYTMKRVEIPLSLPHELLPKNLDSLKAHVEEIKTSDAKTALDQKLRYTNRIDFYVPKKIKAGEKRPAILISPILGGNMVVDHFARYYAGRGYVAAIVHRKRLIWEDDWEDVQDVENYMRTSIIRIRQALDWLEVQPEVDSHRIGAFGISYGAILHSILAVIEPRIRYHVLAMPAAPLPDVIIHCPEKAILKLIRKAEEKHGLTREEVYQQLQEKLKTDPIYFAPYVNRDKVQVYVALFDRVVGASRSLGLWKAMGKPKLKVLPFGHYGGILVFPYLQTQSYSALKKHLK